MSFRRFLWPAVLIASVLLLIFSGFLGFRAWQKSKIIIPPDIKNQVSFIIFWPSKSAPVINDRTSIKFDPTNKLLSYVTKTNDGNKITIGEQATPESFTDIPKVYDKFIEDLQQYASFDSVYGKVFLARPKELKGGQTVVMNAKGTLILLRPDKDVSEDTWRKIFNNLQLIQ